MSTSNIAYTNLLPEEIADISVVFTQWDRKKTDIILHGERFHVVGASPDSIEMMMLKAGANLVNTTISGSEHGSRVTKGETIKLNINQTQGMRAFTQPAKDSLESIIVVQGSAGSPDISFRIDMPYRDYNRRKGFLIPDEAPATP